VSVHGNGEDVAIVSFANGYYLSWQAQPQIEGRGVKTRLIDLHWLNPLPVESLLKAVVGAKSVLIVDETRRTGGVSEALMTLFTEHCPKMPVARLAAQDSFIATGPAYAATMPSYEDIVVAALKLAGKSA
jgi:2-oxoisovalerate dehydrogenase E1 component